MLNGPDPVGPPPFVKLGAAVVRVKLAAVKLFPGIVPGLIPVKVTPFTVVFDAGLPKSSAPTNVPAVLTSLLPVIFCAAPQVTTAA